MQQKKLSSRFFTLARSVLAAVILPVFLIYIMIDKPDYKIMNGLSHVVLPVASWVGDVVSWPVRAIGNAAGGIRELSNLRSENEELRTRLDNALQNKNICDIAIAENQKLARELDIVRTAPQRTIVAGVTYDNKAFHHNTFFINKGVTSGVKPGMAVISFEGALVGTIIDAGPGFARVRSLTDTKSNIAVRIAGSEVYGFLAGNGSNIPTLGFFSDPEFESRAGLKLLTSNIRGVFPDGILVGDLINQTDVSVSNPGKISTVMVLQFETQDDKYK